MGINAEVQKIGAENALSTIRKFSRRVQGTGLVKLSRKRRYFERDASKIVKKKRALKLIKRRAEFRQKVKEGKISDTPTRPGFRGPQTGNTQSRESSSPARLGESAPIAH